MSDNLKSIEKSLKELVQLESFKNRDLESWNKKNNKEKIIYLDQLGFSKEIITILVGTTLGTVNKEISISKKSE